VSGRDYGPDWVAATSNRGKLAELRALLEGTDITLHPQDDFGIRPPDETAPTFVENALLKARHAALVTGLPALADDSGLSVPALGGAPGVRSARFAGPECSDADNVERLLLLLESFPAANRAAQFHCVVVALRTPTDPVPLIGSGSWYGWVAAEPRGAQGFGYDPVFVDARLKLTAAELPLEVKNRISHRAQALAALRALLRAAS
jgi:XTP/dITP diphosphohydrolase